MWNIKRYLHFPIEWNIESNKKKRTIRWIIVTIQWFCNLHNCWLLLCQSGITTVEYALWLPYLMSLLFGVGVKVHIFVRHRPRLESGWGWLLSPFATATLFVRIHPQPHWQPDSFVWGGLGWTGAPTVKPYHPSRMEILRFWNWL